MKKLISSLLLLVSLSIQGAVINGPIFPIQSGAFAPTSLPNLVLWLDGSDATQLFKDTGLATQVTADGDAVNGWKDKSGQGNHFLATTATTTQATYKTGIKNGKSIVRFNGTASQFSKTMPSLTARSIFIVLVDTSSSASGYGAVLVVNSSTHGLFVKRQPGPNYQLNVYTGADNDSANIAPNTWKTFTAIWDGSGNWTGYKDGTSFGTGTADATLTYDRLGGHGSEWHSGDIAEVIIYSDTKNSTDKASVESYLTSKWNLP